MAVASLLLTFLLLSPWLVQFARYAVRRPEAIPTPTWLVTSSVVFLFVFPLIGALFSGERFDGHDQASVRIMFTTIVYWVTFTVVYLLASGRSRTVVPDGPRGIPTSFGVLKLATTSMSVKKAMVVFVPLTATSIYFMQSTGLGISGKGLAMLDLPYHLVIIRLLTMNALPAFTAVFSSHLFGSSPLSGKVIAGMGVLVNLVLAVMAGRRPVLYTLVLVALGVMWTGKRRHAVTLLFLGAAVWFMLFVFSPIFLRARSIWQSPNSPGVVMAFQRAISEGADNEESLDAASEENIKQRMNSYLFWLQFYDRFPNENLGGVLLIQAVVMNIPRAIAGWAKYAYGATEEDIFGTRDIANNVCLESAIDLGFFGPLVYGAIFGLVFATIDWLVVWMSLRNKYIALMAIGAYFSFLLSPEADLMAYIGTLRHMIILAVVTYLSVLVLGIKSVTGAIARRGPPSVLNGSAGFVG